MGDCVMKVKWTEILGHQHRDPYMGFMKTGEQEHSGIVVGYVVLHEAQTHAVIVEKYRLTTVSIDDLVVVEGSVY